MLVLLHFTFVARVSGHPMQGRHLFLGLNRPATQALFGMKGIGSGRNYGVLPVLPQ